MKQPLGFTDPQLPHHVCKLHKSLYGLKQAPRAWNQKFYDFMITKDFLSIYLEPSLFVHKNSSLSIYILLYVDDILITGSDKEKINVLTKLFAR